MANALANEDKCLSEKEHVPSEISGAIEKFEEISLSDSELYGGDTDDEMEEDDLDTNGENPVELEVEKYCQPSKRVIMEEIENASIKRNLLVWPLSMADIEHQTIKDCIAKCSQFKFSYHSPSKCLKNHQDKTWVGMLKLTFHSSFDAEDAVEPLKAIREEVQVLRPTNQSHLSQTVADWKNKSASSNTVSVKDLNMMLVKKLPLDATPQDLRRLIPSSVETIIPASDKSTDGNSTSPKIGLVFFSSSQDLEKVIKEHESNPLKIGPDQIKLKLFSYQPPQLPNGLLKMDRRYKEMVQLKQLKKIYKEKSASMSPDQKTKLMDGIKRSRNFLEKDDKIRTELNLPLHSWKELRRIKIVRDSIPSGTQWLPFSSSLKEKFSNNSACAGRTKKRRVDQRKGNRNLGQPPNGSYLRNESFALSQTNNFMDRMGKNQWMIPFNFGLYSQMANMMNQMAYHQAYWPIYGSGGYHHETSVRGHGRGRSSNRDLHLK